MDPCKLAPSLPPLLLVVFSTAVACQPDQLCLLSVCLSVSQLCGYAAVMFMSGSDDGTVRHYDTREPASANSIPGMRTGDVLGEQLQSYSWAKLVCLIVSSAES